MKMSTLSILTPVLTIGSRSGNQCTYRAGCSFSVHRCTYWYVREKAGVHPQILWILVMICPADNEQWWYMVDMIIIHIVHIWILCRIHKYWTFLNGCYLLVVPNRHEGKCVCKYICNRFYNIFLFTNDLKCEYIYIWIY